ncbi:hypothetical protein [Vibrio mediterranei]|uniref:hypothetical protein n=1 Tax=Vibrio mediterranei TaxID=689 RepID=UPI004067922B
MLAKHRKTDADSDDQWAYFEYDSVNRLISADYPKFDDIAYEWDDSGNLIAKQTKTHRYEYQYNAANQLVELTGHCLPGFACDDSALCSDDDEEADNNRFSYRYDANGYMTQVDNGVASVDYQHDAQGRLIQVRNPDQTQVRYGYDARSLRVLTERTLLEESGLNTYSLASHYDGRQEQGQWQTGEQGSAAFPSLTLLPDESMPYGQVLHQAIYDTESSLAHASGSKGADESNLYVHHNRLGSAIQVLDATGREAMRLGYSPFGQVY